MKLKQEFELTLSDLENDSSLFAFIPLENLMNEDQNKFVNKDAFLKIQSVFQGLWISYNEAYDINNRAIETSQPILTGKQKYK